VGGRGPGPADGGTAPDGQFTGWGEYWPAIRRWEHVTGRPCPSPVQPGRNGPILSARFTEWLMGMDDGWVTDPAIGLTRNQQIKLCGNGAVTLQAAAALEDMLAALHNRELLRFAANYGSMP
jgi:DNA (cytosine-5)-methyltransferase 1